jgi:tetratricopeptide (TPR) repeat protein
MRTGGPSEQKRSYPKFGLEPQATSTSMLITPPAARKQALRKLIIPLLVLGAGCAHVSRSQDPRNWLELESEHFVLRTDVPEEQARKHLDDMEQVREALMGVSWVGARPSKGRVIVVLLADRSEMKEFADEYTGGFATYDAFEQQIIVLDDRQDVYIQTVFKHELTHILSDGLARPRWLSEGLACYVETLALKRGEPTADLGRPDSDRLIYLRRWYPRTWFEFISADSGAYEGGHGYGFETYAWVLTHHLVDHKPEALRKYLDALGSGMESWLAFTAAFPGLREEELAATMTKYISTGQYGHVRVPVRSWQGTLAVRALPPAEVLALRADLLRRAPDARSHPEVAAREVEKALAADPGNAYALMLKNGASAQPATAAHPDDWRSWLLAFDRGGEERADIERAAKLAPGEPSVLARLAVADLHAHEAKGALQHATEAQAAAPTRSDVLEVLAQAYAANGRCTEAIVAEQQAIDLRPDAGVTYAPPAMRARLLDLRNHCQAPKPAAEPVVETVAAAEPEADELKLKSCGAKPPRLTLRQPVQVDFTLDEQGKPRQVVVQGAVDKAVRASLRKFVESCRYEPFQVDGKPQAVPTSLTIAPAAGN